MAVENASNQNPIFVNELVMNEYTMREIASGIWTQKKAKNKIPVLIYLVAVVAPLIYGFLSGKDGYILLTAGILLGGLVILPAYVGIAAYAGAKKREQMIRQTLNRYGRETPLHIQIGQTICYHFHGMEKSIAYQEIEKVIELEMYLILQTKDGIFIPIWKLGFTKGEWDDFIPYFRQKIKERKIFHIQKK